MADIITYFPKCSRYPEHIALGVFDDACTSTVLIDMNQHMKFDMRIMHYTYIRFIFTMGGVWFRG